VIQKKVCMVGVFGAGKTCLVQQFVHSIFTAKYHSTVGVKIDRKVVALDGNDVTLMLWDLEGRDAHQDVSASYLRGSHAVLYVVDGTRRETFDQVFELRERARGAIGEVPSAVALNKSDLQDQWILKPPDDQRLADQGWHAVKTSAKTGVGVEAVFGWIARATLQAGEGTP
jgi:small GTP-binding protein